MTTGNPSGDTLPSIKPVGRLDSRRGLGKCVRLEGGGRVVAVATRLKYKRSVDAFEDLEDG